MVNCFRVASASLNQRNEPVEKALTGSETLPSGGEGKVDGLDAQRGDAC